VNKCYPAVLLALLLVLSITPISAAGQYEWQIVNNEHGNIQESIILQDIELDIDTNEWNCYQENGQMRLERVLEDWTQYSESANGLPVQARIRDYLLFSLLTLTYDDKADEPKNLFNTLTSKADGEISIQVTGMIRDSSASEVNNLEKEPKAVWYLTSENGKNISKKSPFLDVITFDGLLISLTILLLGFTAISLWYIRYVRRVNKLIKKEYSLDNIKELLEKEEESE